MKKFSKCRPALSEDDKKLIGYLTKKKRVLGKAKTNVYFNKSSNGAVKYFNGKFYSAKNKTTFTYRSSYELKFFLDLEANSNVDSYVSEALYVPYTDSTGVNKTYIPDLLVLYKDGRMEILEIKPKAMLKDIDVQKKAIACQVYMRKHYANANIRYRFITEKDLFKNTKEYSDFLKENKNKDFSK